MNTVELVVRDDGVGVVRLNRPDLNIYNLEMRDDLIEAFRAVRDLPEVRAVVLAANGTNFSAGADLSEFGTAESVFEARRIRWWRDPWLPLLDSPKPSVAALHGYALGAGLEMALMCDFRLAAPDTQLGLPETRLGMLPSAGGSQTLARLVGPGRALPVVMGGQNHSAAEALRMGVIDEVVENGDVGAAAGALATGLAALDPALAGAAKRALRAAGDLPLAAGLELERQLLSAVLSR
ncbi:MAG TPA: enoyl-CoA hydratase/isomerase family protein [Acidimicrobiales bacterium]|nr:enoyl-CoA hydratase/isomerase family protein [Acidimicrobiales bacterium]